MALKVLNLTCSNLQRERESRWSGRGPLPCGESEQDRSETDHTFNFSQSRRRAEVRRGTGKKEQRRERAMEKERSGRGGPILDYFVPGPGVTVSWPVWHTCLWGITTNAYVYKYTYKQNYGASILKGLSVLKLGLC